MRRKGRKQGEGKGGLSPPIRDSGCGSGGEGRKKGKELGELGLGRSGNSFSTSGLSTDANSYRLDLFPDVSQISRPTSWHMQTFLWAVDLLWGFCATNDSTINRRKCSFESSRRPRLPSRMTRSFGAFQARRCSSLLDNYCLFWLFICSLCLNCVVFRPSSVRVYCREYASKSFVVTFINSAYTHAIRVPLFQLFLFIYFLRIADDGNSFCCAALNCKSRRPSSGGGCG